MLQYIKIRKYNTNKQKRREGGHSNYRVCLNIQCIPDRKEVSDFFINVESRLSICIVYFSIPPDENPLRSGLKQIASFNPGGCVAFKLWMQLHLEEVFVPVPSLGAGMYAIQYQEFDIWKFTAMQLACRLRGRSGLHTCILICLYALLQNSSFVFPI